MEAGNVFKAALQNDWLNAFPELSAFSKDKLYKLVGPLIIGIELIKMRSGEDYRLHFVVYSLWGVSWAYVKHQVYFGDMIESVKHELPVSLEGNLDLNSIIKIFNLTMIKNHRLDSDHFKAFYIDVETWLVELSEKVKNPQSFIHQVQINKEDRKISKLKSSEILF